MSSHLYKNEEAWLLVERYIKTNEFRLVFNRGNEVNDISVSEKSWRSFDVFDRVPRIPSVILYLPRLDSKTRYMKMASFVIAGNCIILSIVLLILLFR